MMKRGLKDRYFTLGLGAAIVLVLVVLGVLQYRWSNQISEANEAQIGANLRSLMLDWHFDLFRDFSAIAVGLQVGPDSGARDDWRDYLARYEEWRESATDPEIVQSVFLFETSAAPGGRLIWLDTEHSRIMPSQVPDEMHALLQHLEQNSSSLEAGLNAWNAGDLLRYKTGDRRHDPGRTDPMTGWQFDPNIPALVHPVVHHAMPGEKGPRVSEAVDWIIVKFDLGLLRTELLPKLTR